MMDFFKANKQGLIKAGQFQIIGDGEPINPCYMENLPRGKKWFYYPGAFGVFHGGHVAMVRKALISDPEGMVAIAPAHSSYTSEKYKGSSIAGLKGRVKRIKDALRVAGLLDRCVVYTTPALNFLEDINIPEQLAAFCFNTGADIKDITLLCGKDRQEFSGLEKHGLKVMHIPAVVDSLGNAFSTSDMLHAPFRPKDLVLRFWKKDEHKIGAFKRAYERFYLDITPSLIEVEIEAVKAATAHLHHAYTICKDYASVLEYIPMHRAWLNQFEVGGYSGDLEKIASLEPGSIVVDSDVFSGGTREKVRDLNDGVMVFPYHVANGREILDLHDFYGPNAWRYPTVDLESRMSLPCFTYEMGLRHQEFLKEIAE